jgi:hypothetical protein
LSPASLETKIVRFRFLLLFLTSLAAAQAPPYFHFTEQPGRFPVGLKVVDQYDYTRTFLPVTDPLGKPTTAERARPIQTLIWYPAVPSSAKKMTVGDYTQLLATETTFDKPHISADWQGWIKAMTPTLVSCDSRRKLVLRFGGEAVPP